MAVAIEKREKKRTRRDDNDSPVDKPIRAKKGSYDTPEVRDRKEKILEWRRQARIAQAENRAEMARDQEYYDGYQWDEEDKAIVENTALFAKYLIVERNKDDPNRVDVLLPPDLVNQLRIFAVLAQFRLQFNE